MAEINHRSLPGSAFLKMTGLERSMMNNRSSLAATPIARQTGKARNTLQLLAQEYTMKAAMADRKREALKERHQQCLRSLQVVAGLMEGNRNEKDRLCLEVLEQETLKKMDACGLDVQLLHEVHATAFTTVARHIQSLKL